MTPTVCGDGWQPISTAPRDGTTIIITDGNAVEAGCFAPGVHGDDYAWAFVDDYTGTDLATSGGGVGVPANAFRTESVTHWQPLPNPPASTLPDAAPDAGSPHSGASGVGQGDAS
jgi:hypothetical protein